MIKKLLLTLILICSLATTCWAATELDYMEYTSDALAQAAYVSNGSNVLNQSWSETNYDEPTYLRYSTVTKQVQTFLADANGDLVQCKFYIKKVGSPTGNIFATLYDTSGGVPTGSAIATSNNYDVSTVGTDLGLITFTFSTTYPIVSGTTYAIGIEGDFTVSTSNYISVGHDSGGGAAGGNFYYWTTSWVDSAPADLCFYIYLKYLQSYSESTIKTQGSYSLKAIASTASLNKTLTRTVTPTIDLTGQTSWKFGIYSSRTGSNIKIGIRDSGLTVTETTPNIISANTWQTITVDISAVIDANKDAIDSIIVTIVDATSSNTFYIDNMYTESAGVISQIIGGEIIY